MKKGWCSGRNGTGLSLDKAAVCHAGRSKRPDMQSGYRADQ